MNSNLNLQFPIVSVDWLHDHMETKNLVVLDGTINKVFDEKQNQIPKARFFDIKNNFSNIYGIFPSTFPSEEQFQKEARKLGINNNSAIIVYDDKGIYSSARVWWLFKAFGYNNVAVLNGGFPEWLKRDFNIEGMKPFQGKEGDFKAYLQAEYMTFFKDVEAASNLKTHTIIDARAASRFNCQVPEPRVGLRMGTIPNSVNLPFTDLLEGGILKNKKELEEAFSKLGDKENAIIFSCGSGITACILALGAHILGYSNISVYDGSWTEWGSLVKE
jgi:thiosulfate/3-mercaptopyruvate sulfurtransferase